MGSLPGQLRDPLCVGRNVANQIWGSNRTCGRLSELIDSSPLLTRFLSIFSKDDTHLDTTSG